MTTLHPGQKIVYQADADGLFVGETTADPDPLNPGQWLVPAGCYEIAPPILTFGKTPKWVGYKWKLISP